MASTVSTRLTLQDGMSGTLQKISKNIGGVVDGFQRVQSGAAGVAAGTGNVKSSMGQMGAMASASGKQLTQSIAGAIAKVGLLSAALKGVFDARKIITYSDEFAGLSARVAMVNDGLQSNEALTQKIFNAANASRSSYKDMAGLVARIGSNAKDAFTSNDEMIAFAEQLNKQFVIGGASAEEMSAATLQLSQALASGTLRGDEFNSIAEQAPTIIGAVSKYLGVMPGQVRALAAEGQITADVVKKAVLAASGETNKAFEQMPKTFSQSWTEFTNQTLNKTKGLLTKINELGNTSAGAKLFEGLGRGIDSLVKSVEPVLEKLKTMLNDPTMGDTLASLAENAVKAAPALVGLAAAAGPLMGLSSAFSAMNGMGLNPFAALLGDGGSSLSIFTKIGNAIPAIDRNVADLSFSFSALKKAMAGSAKGTFLGDLSEKAGSLIAPVKNAFAGVNTVFGDLKAGAFEAFSTMASGIGGIFGGIKSKIVNGLGDILPVITQWIGPALGGLVGSIGSIAAPIGLALAGAVAAGIGGGAILAALGNVEKTFGDSISNMLVEARVNGPRMIEEFASGMKTKLPALIANGTTLVTDVLNTISTLLPSVFNTGGQIIYSLTSGLGQALPQLIPAAAGVITGLLTGLVTNLPMILAGGMQMVLGLVQGLMNSLPTLIDSIPTMIEGFVNGIGTYLPTILETGVKIVFTIAVGLINAIPHIVAAIPSIIGAIWNGIASVDWLSLGAGVLGAIANGLMSMLDALGNAVASIGEFLWNKFKEIGGNIIGGIVEGIKNSAGAHALLQAVRVTAGEDVYNELVNYFQIGSPSKLMAKKIGRFLPSGIAKGFVDAMPEALATMENSVSGIAGIAAPMISPEVSSPSVSPNTTAGDGMNMGIVGAMDTYQATVVATQEDTHAFTTADSALQAQQLVMAYDMMPVGVAAALGNVYNTVVVGMTRVNGFIAQMPALYYGFGVSIMQGLNGGLASQIDAVVDTTNNLVAAVKNAFISGLGIHSPSRVTYDFGHYTGEGFIRGLSNTQLVAFVRKIVGDMKSAFGKGKIDLDALVSYLQGDSTKLADWMDEFDGGSYVKGVPGTGKGDKALKFFLGMINDNSYGYSFGGHGPRDFDCASSISWALRTAGFNMGGGWDTTGVANALFALGWQKVPNNGNPQRGDIVMNEANHVEWALGGGQLAGFHSNYDGVSGDSSGTEASVGAYYDYPWDYYIRYPAGGFGMDGTSMSEAIREAYRRVVLGIVDMGGSGNMNALGDYGSAIGGAARWADVVRQALRLTGQSEQYVGDILWCIENESGGNPYAINNWDSNAAMGDPSRGLMQTIGSTFNAYRLPNLSADIYDPLSNIVAGIRYMLSRYGSIDAVVGPRRQSWYGYADGTNNARRGWAWVGENGPELVNFGGGETVLNNHDSMVAIREAANNGSAPASGSSSGYGLSNVVININMDNVNIASDMDIENVATQLGQYLKEELSYQPIAYHGG